MLSLSKSKKAAAVGWHPDFRDVARLPDLRVVRTGTFMTIIGIALAAASAIYFGQQEYFIHARQSEADTFSQRAEADKKVLAERIQLSKDFDAKVAKIGALASFGGTDPLGSDVFVMLAASKPDGVRFESITITRGTTVVRVIAEGTDTEALLLIPGKFANALRESERVMAMFNKVEPPSFEPPVEGRLEFDIILRR